MWFKNLRVYCLTRPLTLDGQSLNSESLAEALGAHEFVPCNSQDVSRFGWVPPVESGATDEAGELVHTSQGYMMVCAKKQEKVLPAAVVNEALAEKVAAITEAEGRPVGRKERQSLKDDVMMDLLPRAFTRSSRHFAYIAPPKPSASAGSPEAMGYIVVHAASAGRAEELLSALRDALGSVPVVPLTSQQLPYQVMTRWVTDAAAPGAFALGSECELASTQDEGSVIRCKHQDLTSAEIQQLLAADMIVTKLHLSWMEEGVEFILDDQLAIKRLRFADEVQEKAGSHEAETAVEAFDREFSVMTLEIAALLTALTEALGGVNAEAPSVDELVVKATAEA